MSLDDVKGKVVISESKKMKEMAAKDVLRSSKSAPVWNPLGWLKLNADASFIEATGQASTGAVVRNHQGQVGVST